LGGALGGRPISDGADQTRVESEPSQSAEAQEDASPTAATDQSALSWENPIYDEEQWEPPRTTWRDGLLAMLLAAIFEGLVALYMTAGRRSHKGARTQAGKLLTKTDHFWRWPLAARLLTVFAFIAAILLFQALASGYRWAFSMTDADGDGFAGGVLFALGVALFALPGLIIAYRRVLRRRPPAAPPWPQALKASEPPPKPAPAPNPPLPDIVTAPKSWLSGQLLGFIVVLLLAVALVALVRYGPR
jgi:hypothetical protein